MQTANNISVMHRLLTTLLQYADCQQQYCNTQIDNITVMCKLVTLLWYVDCWQHDCNMQTTLWLVLLKEGHMELVRFEVVAVLLLKIQVHCLTLKTKALWSFKISGTSFQVTQHDMREELNLWEREVLFISIDSAQTCFSVNYQGMPIF
jgi:hypothetical protein